MPDTNIPEPDQNGVGAKVADLIASGHELYATAVTGRPYGRVRRPTLFVIAIVGTTFGSLGYWPAAIVAVVAITLLALSDAVVEL
jgi:hypothetical protein